MPATARPRPHPPPLRPSTGLARLPSPPVGATVHALRRTLRHRHALPRTSRDGAPSLGAPLLNSR
eukprot:3893530-Prymnesium_polylepis.1